MTSSGGRRGCSLPLFPPGLKVTHKEYGWVGRTGLGTEPGRVSVIWIELSQSHSAAGYYDPADLVVEGLQINLL